MKANSSSSGPFNNFLFRLFSLSYISSLLLVMSWPCKHLRTTLSTLSSTSRSRHWGGRDQCAVASNAARLIRLVRPKKKNKNVWTCKSTAHVRRAMLALPPSSYRMNSWVRSRAIQIPCDKPTERTPRGQVVPWHRSPDPLATQKHYRYATRQPRNRMSWLSFLNSLQLKSRVVAS
jgi:hypothetical protein